MTTDALKNVLESRPFRPFLLRLADGRALPVNHREFVASSPSGRTVFVFQPDDSFNIVDLLLVSDIEFLPRDRAASAT